jgi:hypothetical protein
MKIQKGSLVRISGKAGTVLGHVDDIRPPAALPDIPLLEGLSRQTRGALIEDGCQNVATISHYCGGERVVFVALQDANGRWWDLHHQPLTIVPEEESNGKNHQSAAQ